MENSKLRIESDGKHVEVYLDGEKIDDITELHLDVEGDYFAELKLLQTVRDKDGKLIIINGEIMTKEFTIPV